ncbi:olfactomedin-4-like [Lampris incognitus]|uniref:olfactomedin-4-like n=1 Tax=Lampris incognitus TaxID=2546036 RepID=UPI0024B566DC|nr:olfactomedin-4-like [Lampris incognitus]
MALPVMLGFFALLTISCQVASSSGSCVCDLKNVEHPFPYDKLETAEDTALSCNQNVNPQKTLEVKSLLMGLERRLPVLVEDVEVLESEDDGDLYGAISLQVIENELRELLQLFNKLNSTIIGNQQLNADTQQQLLGLREDMQTLEAYDTMEVVKRQKMNQRLKRDLEECKNGHDSTVEPTWIPQSNCPQGQFMNVTGPSVYTGGEYPGSYKYGAWGQDPKPDVGKENWYWLVLLTSSNAYSNYVRRYSSLSSLIVGVSVPGNVLISSSNPTTNTIQGPNVVMYGEALYYGCYYRNAVCRFNLTTSSVTSVELAADTRFNSKGNFCYLEACYPYTDLDLATDETGVWVIYTTKQNFGDIVVSKVGDGVQPTVEKTWHTSLYKSAATNTFMMCGVLYATRFVSKDTEEIFYSFNTWTSEERFNLGIRFQKMSANMHSLNFSPVDQMLHAYTDGYMASYHVVFE